MDKRVGHKADYDNCLGKKYIQNFWKTKKRGEKKIFGL